MVQVQARSSNFFHFSGTFRILLLLGNDDSDLLGSVQGKVAFAFGKANAMGNPYPPCDPNCND